jgi:hypothetical protein
MFEGLRHSVRKRKFQSLVGGLQRKQQIPEVDSLSSRVALIEFRIGCCFFYFFLHPDE